MALHSLTVDAAHVRTGGWRGSSELAYLAPLSRNATLTPTALGRIRARLRDEGYSEVVTAAVGPSQRDLFLSDGFVDHEYLHLLSHDLRHLPSASQQKALDLRICRSSRSDIGQILTVDKATFDDFWRFDRTGLAEALHATPTHRLRVVKDSGTTTTTNAEIVGYAITGRAGAQAYLQRLAVAPSHQRSGFGSAMVFDGLRWVRRRGAAICWVNTQVANDAAYHLYCRLGFRAAPHQLTVLRREL